MSTPLVAVVGSTNLDLVFVSPALPRPGETLLAGDFATHPGGKGGNQAVAIAKLGGGVSFVGCIGNDANGTVLRASLESAGVLTDSLVVDESKPSGTAAILVDDQGRNMIVVAPGSNRNLSPDHVRHAYAKQKPTVALAQLEIQLDTVLAAAEAEMFVLNPAPACELPDHLLAKCHVITPNETETESLTGVNPTDEERCRAATCALLEKGVQNVVITLGDRGSYWATSSGGKHFAPPTVKAIDTTAAGDAFSGALAWFLAEGRDFGNAIALANCVGALSTTKPGAQASMPDLEALKQLAGNLY